ncbi:hypothetical protein KEM09_15330 [Carboxylicivirga mesophila]|uniref:DNA alkylation repair protein n=1 Tax=Carboxylicivirga mesophila TaxID=1166478 RepID=A0ABS5KE37_9BACT|nr:hypothetical protein [Carboxylicivirga mesophila]MBS2212791.1 hypothetical protein [Carboxylicivirga mesophila]
MADLFKNLYSQNFFEALTDALQNVLKRFNRQQFLQEIYDTEWEELELKQRMHHITTILTNYLSSNYPKSIEQIEQVITWLQQNRVEDKVKYPDLVFMIFPHYIELTGLHDFNTSIRAFESITPFSTCELAVRPFIIKYEDKMMNVIQKWTAHPNEHVRRLASEGCRPRLPWGMALRRFKHDPTPVIPVLEALKKDDSAYVRKSVANNLNDISMDNPQVTIDIAHMWKGLSMNTDWIVKHACRTLLKAGNREVLELFGFGVPEHMEVRNFSILNDRISVGDDLEFSFKLYNHSNESILVRLEYAIYFLKQKGHHTRKVFKISEKNYAPGSCTVINRRQSFKLVSSRKYHSGEHYVSLIINGSEFEEAAFTLQT